MSMRTQKNVPNLMLRKDDKGDEDGNCGRKINRQTGREAGK